MKRFLMLGGLAVLAAAGAFWWTKRSAPGGDSQAPASRGADATTSADAPRPSDGPAINPPEEQPGSERTATPAPADAAAAAEAGRASLSLAQLSEYRRLAAELIKTHSADSGDGADAQAAAWPVDSDSLLAKYAALDKAGVVKVLADIHGLIEWQGRGPFEDKQAELLPGRVMLALEAERDWLTGRLQEL